MKKVQDFLYEEESYKIRGACFTVWNVLGSAFKESSIDKALTKEIEKLGLKVEDQKRIAIMYDGEQIGTYIPDKVIEDKIILELKRKSFITRQDIKNFWNYLRGSDYKLGFLVNFGDNKLEIRRVVYDKKRRVNSA
jgi:GxxExxY protein